MLGRLHAVGGLNWLPTQLNLVGVPKWSVPHETVSRSAGNLNTMYIHDYMYGMMYLN